MHKASGNPENMSVHGLQHDAQMPEDPLSIQGGAASAAAVAHKKAAICSNRAELMERLKRGESPTWVPTQSVSASRSI